MSAGKNTQGSSYHPTAWSQENEQLFGMYLGQVTHTRAQDLWVQLTVPQIFGDQDSNWARPIGFNMVGADSTPPYGPVSSIWPEEDPHQPYGWGSFTSWPYTGQQALGYGTRAELGPGPGAGSLVVVLFLGGDRNRPGYLLTSQHVG